MLTASVINVDRVLERYVKHLRVAALLLLGDKDQVLGNTIDQLGEEWRDFLVKSADVQRVKAGHPS